MRAFNKDPVTDWISGPDPVYPGVYQRRFRKRGPIVWAKFDARWYVGTTRGPLAASLMTAISAIPESRVPWRGLAQDPSPTKARILGSIIKHAKSLSWG